MRGAPLKEDSGSSLAFSSIVFAVAFDRDHERSQLQAEIPTSRTDLSDRGGTQTPNANSGTSLDWRMASRHHEEELQM